MNRKYSAVILAILVVAAEANTIKTNSAPPLSQDVQAKWEDLGLSADVNEYVDKTIHKIVPLMKDVGLDPMDLPEVVEGFEVRPLLITYSAWLKIHHGYMTGLVNVERSGDQMVHYFAKMLRVRVKLQIRDLRFVNADLSKKILKAARRQQAELEDDVAGPSPAKKVLLPTSLKDGDSDDESGSDHDEQEPDTYYDNIEINEDDEEALKMFMSAKPERTRTLADIIKDKITDKHTELQTQFSDVETLKLQNIDPRIKVMYEGVRDVLKKYRSGKLPKAFKMIPHLQNWEQILYITEPTTWSAAAMYQATRIFASNLKEKMAQRFYNLVLLPRVRDDLAEYKRLNFHLYQALRKSLFKPGAFMKGILLPLLEAGDCSLREAIIIGSVLARNSVPVLHSSAALLKIAEMDYTGANSIFLRILFDKKYALPYRVVDSVVFHFLRFQMDSRTLPVLWHQALLTFVQRYKADISSEQRDALLELLRKQSHPTITQDIRRELQAAKCRDVETNEEANCMAVE